MKKDNYNNFNKQLNNKQLNNINMKKADQAYAYYSRVLKEPFDSIEELVEAEEAYYAKLKAKEDKAAAKKADAAIVEEAFKALNAARKAYKAEITEVTDTYRKSLTSSKKTFEDGVKVAEDHLATAETAYQQALKAFTDKYPEGYHITLKDGDFETTISGKAKNGSISDLINGNPFIDLIFKDFI